MSILEVTMKYKRAEHGALIKMGQGKWQWQSNETNFIFSF